MASIQTFLKGTLGTAAGLGTVGLGLLYYGQNYLIYPSAFPPGSRTEVSTPMDHGLPYEDLTLDTSDGVRIRAYLLLQRRYLPGDQAEGKPLVSEEDVVEADRKFASTRPTVLMFHGNGGNIGHRVPLARIFYSKIRCNVILLSYRGYGLSEGQPSEAGLRIDSQTVLDFVHDDPVLSLTSVILYGQSIGGAVAISLAAQNPESIKALILENTFLSIPRLIPSAIPWLSPFTWLCHQQWDSATSLTHIPRKTPILMLSGSNDEIVPREHMVGLWEIAIGKNKPTRDPVQPDPPTATEPKGERVGDGGTPESENDASKKKQEGEIDEQDTKEYVEYASVEGVQVMLSKRTKHRVWKEFENGTHNDTCVQLGYWAAVAHFINTLVPLDQP